jgi:hypothetical protein
MTSREASTRRHPIGELLLKLTREMLGIWLPVIKAITHQNKDDVAVTSLLCDLENFADPK